MIHHAHGRKWVDFGQIRLFWLCEKRTNLLEHRFESFINFNFWFLVSLDRFEFGARFELFKPLISTSINHFLIAGFKFYPVNVFLLHVMYFKTIKNKLWAVSKTVNDSKSHINHYRAFLYVFEYKIARKKHIRLSRNKSWNQPYFWLVDFRLD